MHSPTDFADSLFWSITSPAGAQSFVFGTLHLVDNTKIVLPIAELEQILREKSTVFVEINPHDLDEYKEQGAGSFGSGSAEGQKKASEVLSPEDLGRLRALFANSPRLESVKDELEQFPSAVLAQFIKAEAQLRSPLFESGNFEPETHLVDYALAAGIPVVSLENIDDQIAHMWENEDLAEELEKYYAGDAIDVFARYAQQNLELLPEEDHNSPMMLQRNRDMAAKLDDALRESDGMVLIGAAHLPFETGILANLTHAGWTVEKVELPVEQH